MSTIARIRGCALAALGLVLCAGAAPEDLKIPFEKYTLANGLQVILHVDRKLPFVHVNEWVHVGSKDEKVGRTGFAHLFEHLMFEGSKNAKGKYISYAEKLGANLMTGGVNGTTANDRTNYFITAPSASLETMLWLEADRIATLGEALTKENLDHQRDVVKNERRQGLENTPYGRWDTLLDGAIFPAGHPYSWPVIGSQEDLTAATFEDVKAFFSTYYTPNNLTLTITGDFEPAEARRLVAKYWAGIPAGPALDRPGRWIPVLAGERIVDVRDRVPLERTYFGWPAPAYFQAGGAELDLAAVILSDGLASRLQKALIYDRQLCADVVSMYLDREIAGEFVIWATARAGASMAEIERLVGEELARLAKDGPTVEELDRAKNKYETGFVGGLERIGGFGGKADKLAMYNTYLGDPDRFGADLERYRAATVEGVRKAVASTLDTPNRVLVRFRPEASGRADGAPLDRSVAPPPVADKAFRCPAVKSAKLANGLEVMVVERPELPKLALTFVARAGSRTDPAGKSGLAQLAATAMSKGTATRTSLDIEKALGTLGTAIGTAVRRESVNLSMDLLKRNLAPAMDIFADVIMHPAYPEASVALERKQLLDTLAQDAMDPSELAGAAMMGLVFGMDHPYGQSGKGRPGSVAALTREDLAGFHGTWIKPDDSALVFAGDVTLEEAVAAATRCFGAWRGKAPALAPAPPARPMPGTVFAIDRQGAAQTVIAQVLPGPGRRASDFYAARLVDAVWGGGFNTRLNLNLREDKGYSYGTFSFLAALSDRGFWAAEGGVQADKTRESIAEFRKELDAIAGARPITGKELEEARNGRIRGYAQNFETLGNLAFEVAALWTLGLPPGELQKEYDLTRTQTLAQVQAAEKKYMKPAETKLLLVGDRTLITAAAKDLGLGEVTFLDAEGRVVK